MLTEKTKAILAWLNVCVFWGTTYLAIRIGVGHLPPMLFAGIRWTLAGVLFVLFLRWRGQELPQARDFPHLAVVGLALLGVANGLVVFAEQWIPSGLTALILTTTPFVMFGVESLLPKGPRLNWAILGGLALGLTGVGFIFGEDLKYLDDPDNVAGVLALMGAVLFWSAGSLYSKYVRMNVQPLMGAAFQMLIAGIFLCAAGTAAGELPRLRFEVNGLLALGYLVAFGSLAGYTSYIYAVAKLPLSLVSTFAYINPVIALVLGWIVLGERLDWRIALAAGVIFTGVYVVKRGADRSRPIG